MANPKVSQLSVVDAALKFTLSGVNVSIANALRRIILSEIPTLVFRTTPHDKNLATFVINTSRLNNELIKQRLSCIPIHITDVNFEFQDYILEVDVKNESDMIQFITTADFKIKHVSTDSYLTDAQTKVIFPPDIITGDYIDFVRLRPRISDDIPGEHLKLSCKFDIGTAAQDNAFNVVSTAAYGNTPDPAKVIDAWAAKEAELKKTDVTAEELEFAKKDWHFIDGKRHFLEDSFDFTIESVGPFSNMSIIHKAIEIMITKLNKFKETIQSEQDIIIPSESTIPYCYDVTLNNEGYTLGKVIEYIIYSNYYGKAVTYCGFRKPHPHIDNSVIRIAFKEQTDRISATSYFSNAANEAITCYRKLLLVFEGGSAE
jgi:DNA-directed RNA polymerase subunit L